VAGFEPTTTTPPDWTVEKHNPLFLLVLLNIKPDRFPNIRS